MKSCSVIILTADQFEDMEVLFPYFRLLEEGVKVHVAAPSKETLHGEHGYALNPDKTLDEVDPDDYGLLIIPGGSLMGLQLPCATIQKPFQLQNRSSPRTKVWHQFATAPTLLFLPTS